MVIAIAGTISITAFAADPIPFVIGTVTPTAEIGTDITITSRVSFDSSSDIAFDGAGSPKAEVTSDLTRLSFTSLDFKKISVDGIRIQNHGSTNTIASLRVDAPSEFLIDARSPPNSPDLLRRLGPNEFAVPIEGAVGSTPGIAEVQLELMFWNSTSFVSTDKTFKPDLWSAMTAYLRNVIFNFQEASANHQSVTVIKWQDTNKNGVEDSGEPRLSGWTIQVFEKRADGTLNLRGTGVTNSNGVVVFSGGGTLPKDRTYVVREVFPSAPPDCIWVQTFPGGPTFQHEFFMADHQQITVKFGNVLECTSPLTVVKWFDEDGDGVEDSSESRLSGWTIKVFDSTGNNLIAQGTTGSSGTVTFNLVYPATYIVREEFPAVPIGCEGEGWVQIFPGEPSFQHSVSHTSAGSTVKFGNALQCKATVFKFFDEDGDGVHDLSEGGLQGWKIRIYDETGSILIDEKFTDASGLAGFNLEPNNSYIAREVIPGETSCLGGVWHQTFPGPPDFEHKFFMPADGGVSLKFGNFQECPTKQFVIELRVSSLD